MASTCPHEHGDLTALREWAWAHGRTDVVLTLDLHARLWAFHSDPSPGNLLRLAAIAPADGVVGPWLHRLAVGGGSADERARLGAALRGSCETSCLSTEAGLAEIRAGPAIRSA